MQDKAFLEQVMRLIEENFQNSQFKLADLQQMLGLSKTQLYRKMMAITGLSAGHFLRKRRLEQAMRLLVEQPSMNITEVAYACGFDDIIFRRHSPPNTARRQVSFKIIYFHVIGVAVLCLIINCLGGCGTLLKIFGRKLKVSDGRHFEPLNLFNP